VRPYLSAVAHMEGKKTLKEQVIECQDSITLACECSERIILLGRAVDWYEEDRLEFSCECARDLPF
jgi:hypothetical protein